MTEIHVWFYKGLICDTTVATRPVVAGRLVQPQMLIMCPNCKRTHAFNSMHSRSITTPSEKRSYNTYIASKGIVTLDIDVGA